MILSATAWSAGPVTGRLRPAATAYSSLQRDRPAELRYLAGGRQLGRIATVGADGTPHVVPVDGMWLDGAAWFGGHPSTRHTRNLRGNPAAVLHLDDGHFVEASWDNYFYTRQWNTPPEMNVVIIDDSESPEPGGAGEFGVAATCGAIACAYARATGTVPTYFPLAHKEPLPFEPYPTFPPVPKSPTDGLSTTF